MTFIRKTQKDFISILLPVKNAQRYVSSALDSMLSQTYGDFELVAVDHASSDDSGEILRKYAKKDTRIRVIPFKGENFVDCLNAGLENCRGEFIARMDADDFSRRDRLALQVSYLRANPDIGIVGTGVEMFGERSVKEGYRRYGRWINSLTDPDEIGREIFVESPIPHPSAMMRREILTEKLGGYRDMGWPEDYDLWLRAHFAGVRMAKLPQRLIRWRDHPLRFSRAGGRYSRRNFHRLRAYYLAKISRGKKIVLQGAGTTGRTIGKFLVEYGADLHAYIDINPRRAGGTKLG